MKHTAILKALVLKMEQGDDSADVPDRNTRILIGATVQLIGALAIEAKIPKFDFDNELEKAFLVMAVNEVCPESLTDEDREVVELFKAWGERSKS